MQKLNLGEEHNIQCARLRRAWSAVRLFYTHAEQDRSKVSSTDLDSMLDEGELRNAKQTFWRRYKMRFPPELHPADATVSRVSRELDKRMLCVYNVWKVRTLQFQLHTTQKKRKLGDGLFTEEAEDESPAVQDAEAYLDRLYSLMLAYAIAGSAGVTGAPSLTEEGTLGSDSTMFVVAPLDVLMSYYFRAKRTSQQIPHSRRLVWFRRSLIGLPSNATTSITHKSGIHGSQMGFTYTQAKRKQSILHPSALLYRWLVRGGRYVLDELP